jgi:hypothetical protein
MWRAVQIGIILIVVAGCFAAQPESNRTVAAFEVPLHTPSDRTEFLSLIRQEAEAEGLHVDAASDDSLRQMAEASPAARMTIHAAVWRGTEDAHSEATIMDGHDHLGLVWIMFAQGEDIELATRFRERVMSRIVLRWPETTSLPVMPTGSIPNPYQLVKTPSGYKLDPAYVSGYDVEPSSPLVFGPEAD